jgi:hypothetical protein
MWALKIEELDAQNVVQEDSMKYNLLWPRNLMTIFMRHQIGFVVWLKEGDKGSSFPTY